MTAPAAGAANPHPIARMLRAASIAALAVGGVLGLAGLVLEGAAAGASAGVGAALVLAFSGSTLVVMGAARRLHPVMTLALAMALYTTKVSVLLLVAPAVAAHATRPWAAAGTTAASLAWSVALVIAFTRLRLPVLAPGNDAAGEAASGSDL